MKEWEKQLEQLVGKYTLDGIDIMSIHNLEPVRVFIKSTLEELIDDIEKASFDTSGKGDLMVDWTRIKQQLKDKWL